MATKAEMFFSGLKSKKVAVIGTGVSHADLIKLFCKKGIDVTVLDLKKAEELGSKYDEFKAFGANFSLGESYLDNLSDYDVIFRTPGMYFNRPELSKAREAGCVVTSEMEVFFDICPCKIYAITGSDGKTTTTSIVSNILKADGKTVHMGGNIGKTMLPYVEDISSDDVAVVELSSFQLISMRQSPDVAVITNISPNHLDVHGEMKEYIGAKCNLIWHQNAFSKTILNLDNKETADLSRFVRGRLVWFSRQNEVRDGAFLDSDGYIVLSSKGENKRLMHKDLILLPGIHNVENYLAAISAVYQDVSSDSIIKVAETFGGVEHRIEFVRDISGVRWYNDSIATSPTRTIAGLNSFAQKLIVIAGGYDKNIPYEPLAPKIIEKVKTLILMGNTAPKIETAVKKCDGYVPSDIEIIYADDMEEAVKKAREVAEKGDIVTLSPASASFDKYANFEVRGNHFKDLVNAMGGRE